MSVSLNCSPIIHDTFLHISPALYMKIFTQIAPLIQLSSKDNFIFWCVKDTSLSGNFVNLNSKFSEKLGLKSGETYKISVGSFKSADLTKVVVSLPNFNDDWTFLHEHFESIQALILDQIRLIKRGEQYPIYTSIRNHPIWIKIEEFGGYQPSDKLGIISDDTELVIAENQNNIGNENVISFPTLLAVPHIEFNFLCNPCHKLAQICSFKDNSFKISYHDAVPQNVILIPEIIMEKVFKLTPKTKITLSLAPNSPIEYSSICHYSIDCSNCVFDNSEHLMESIISASNGIAVKISQSTSDEIELMRQSKLGTFNTLAEFLHKSSSRLILFYGSAGIGKTKHAFEAMNQLNYSSDFAFKIIYIDLLTSDPQLDSDFDVPSLFIFDHVDEYLLMEIENDEKNIRKYINLCQEIKELLLQKGNRILFITRTTKSFCRFSTIVALPFDSIFAFEKSKSQTWEFSKTSEPLACIYGLEEAKQSLERHILNPLQFSNIYHANQMNLHSSVLICGPSGTGKTFLAQKFIEHYRIACISVHGPEILDKYVGASERGVRDLFSRARDLKPCIIFFDEFDSLVPKRGSNQSGVTDRIVNQFLTELDGTEDRSGIFIIATSSRPDLIDKAILRPGRIDQRIELSFPSLEEIKQFIIGKGIKRKKLKPLLNVLHSNQNIDISWADLASVDWNDTMSSLNNLIKSLQVPKQSQINTLNSVKFAQKLSLA